MLSMYNILTIILVCVVYANSDMLALSLARPDDLVYDLHDLQ